ncbi:MAG: hypothetical protein Q7S34_04185 [bacterium]|nr:hypothetical protein [bacterium]
MNNTTVVIGGVAAVLIVGGLVFYAMNNTNPSPTDTTSTTDTTDSTNNNQTPVPGMPSVVTSATAYPAETAVVVSGSVTPNGAFTSYGYEFGTTASFGNKTSNQSVGSGFATIPAPAYISGLSKNTTYFFRLVAENTFGRVFGNQYTFKTSVGTPAPTGSTPTIKTLAVNGILRTSTNLNGEVTPNGASTKDWFEYGKTANLGNTTALSSVGDGSVKVSASVALSNLDPLTTYYYRLNAQNQFGTVNGAILNFKTAGPITATPPSATTRAASTIETKTATLHATIVPNGAETTYWFEYSTDQTFGSALLKTTAKKVTGATISPVTIEVKTDISVLKTKTNYYFRIVAENSQGLVRGDRQTFQTK